MRWAVLVGGTGSNLRAILASGLTVDLVVSHKAGVGALDIAREFNVKSAVLRGKDYPDRTLYDQALFELLRQHQIDAVAMAGFLRWLTPEILRRYPGSIINLHPSLLPAYPGLEAIERAYHDRVWWSGVTVHFVDEGHDSGPIISQVPVPRYPEDSLETFQERIHEAEHRLYPRVLHAMNDGLVTLKDSTVHYPKEAEPWIHGR